MSYTTDLAGAGLLLLVLVAVWLFWLWSRRNEKATVERIKRYQAPLDESSPPGPGFEVPPVAGAEAAPPEQLDQKIATLNRLLQAANEQTTRLERVIEEAKRLGR